MNRLPLLTVALVLTAAASPAARAQTPKKPAPVAAPAPKSAPVDPLNSLRAHLAALRSLPLTQPQAVLRAPRTVPLSFTPWANEVPVAMSYGTAHSSVSSGCFR